MRTQSLALLFVCTANIARSPYAERRARMLLGTAPVSVASAGVPGFPDQPMDAEMAEQLRIRGGDPADHCSRKLDDRALEQAEVVLTFEIEHQQRILKRWPAAAERTFGLHQFADALGGVDAQNLDSLALVSRVRSLAEPNSTALDVADPHGRGRRAARIAAREIDGYMESIVGSLLGTPIAGGRRAEGSPLWRLLRSPRRRGLP